MKPSRTTPKFRPSAGFTLIEVLVCVAILASVIMTMFAVFTHLNLEIRRSRNRTLATQAAQMVLETIIASPHDAREYHGLTSETLPPPDSPVQTEILAWRNSFATFPVKTAAHVTVGEAPFCAALETEEKSLVLCRKLLQVTVEIRYQNHGREAVQELSVTLEPS
ncbi:MAG: prepilin-type N-terminal cleavage/methylation domain-containing protein [bacterium]|nr:prepilin-type N-terminal cleavage/methylation domain-containing protein [bacterium]